MTAFTLPSTHGRVVTVLGGGVLGRRIACAWAASGFDVTIRDPSAEQRIAAKHYCDTSMPQYSDSSRRGTVRAVEDMAASVSDAWLVIEAVPEKLPSRSRPLPSSRRSRRGTPSCAATRRRSSRATWWAG
ncbi:hypothetical protein ACCO45_013004 [Purpureocillium lilacinum]|uniref:Uncharacterized protein n=1 Tax=Purpureocillium lilacinum TaxID=33203 RepID=A0ACC4D9Z5_PURLI